MKKTDIEVLMKDGSKRRVKALLSDSGLVAIVKQQRFDDKNSRQKSVIHVPTGLNIAYFQSQQQARDFIDYIEDYNSELRGEQPSISVLQKATQRYWEKHR